MAGNRGSEVLLFVRPGCEPAAADYNISSPALSPLVLLRPLGCGVALLALSKIPAQSRALLRRQANIPLPMLSLVVRHTQRRSACRRGSLADRRPQASTR